MTDKNNTTIAVGVQTDVPSRMRSLPDYLTGILAIRRGYYFSASADGLKSGAPVDKVRAFLCEHGWSVLSEIPRREDASWVKYWRGKQTKEIWQALFERDKSLIVLGTTTKQEWWWTACSATPEALSASCDELRDVLPLTAVPPNSSEVTFWNMGEHGPHSTERFLDCPAWNGDLIRNYVRVGRGIETNGACPALANLVELRRPEGRGSLILMHGAPGTGKTYAIRSLIRAWSSWCDSHYVVDPETLFKNPEYMTRVLVGHDDDSDAGCECDDCRSTEASKWRLVVMEDADEFLAMDAKLLVGQSLARLLNITDGIMGQGLRLLVLITTNEPLSKIHEAISREGRCLANLHFKPLQEPSALEWLLAHGATHRPRSAMTLAELYAAKSGKRQIGQRTTP